MRPGEDRNRRDVAEYPRPAYRDARGTIHDIIAEDDKVARLDAAEQKFAVCQHLSLLGRISLVECIQTSEDSEVLKHRRSKCPPT